MAIKMNKYTPPDFETIQKANAGDSAAMQKLLAHYNAYVYAEEIKSRLMKAVLKFDIDR